MTLKKKYFNMSANFVIYKNSVDTDCFFFKQYTNRQSTISYLRNIRSTTAKRAVHIVHIYIQEGLAVASIARDVVVEMTPPRDDNAQ